MENQSLLTKVVGRSKSLAERGVLGLLRGPVRSTLLRSAHRRADAFEVSVVTVNYNAIDCLKTLVHAVRRFSPPDTEIVVVDNSSHDGSREWLRSQPSIRSLRLPFNVGHGAGLDLGFLVSRGKYVIALDIDAFPIASKWIEEVVVPLKRGAEVAGAEFRDAQIPNRIFVHPCFLAMRRQRYLEMNHHLESRGRYVQHWDPSGDWYDVGEFISEREREHLHFVPLTSTRGPALVGSVFGGVVYHNWYSTRFTGRNVPILDGVVQHSDASGAWREALQRYFPELVSEGDAQFEDP